jgi:hypothetical protein
MTDGPLRPLALAVAAGMTASATLLNPAPPETDEAPPEIPPALAALAQAQNVDAEDLLGFLQERAEIIGRFAQSVLSDV